MVKVVFLGTTCMQPTKDRNHSGIYLKFKEQEILFDCGEGIQRQMRIAGLKPTKLKHICISHWHGDHVLGLPGLLSTMAANQYSGTLHIYGPKGSRKRFLAMQKAFSCGLDQLDVQLHELGSSGLVFEGKDFELHAQSLEHCMPCFGYSFVEKDRRRIKVALAKKLGLAGPVLGKLQQGKNVVHKGKKVKCDDVTTVVKGKKIAYVADTKMCQSAVVLAMDADLLISESTFHSEDAKKALEFHHMTSADAGKLAVQAGVGKLVLTHPSLRYKTTSALVREAKKYFKGSVSFAKDFMEIKV